MLFECGSAILVAERLFAEVAGGRGSPQTKETRHRCAGHDCQSHNRPYGKLCIRPNFCPSHPRPVRSSLNYYNLCSVPNHGSISLGNNQIYLLYQVGTLEPQVQIAVLVRLGRKIFVLVESALLECCIHGAGQ